ncbi:MAG: hypothetical protein EU532_05655 [Promethearchaeota archaeon]|nr:MAG: hypothetical protein EU532_05655 [Candidatus Lokiarchaeota archaeon]
MNSIERVRAALKFKRPDKVPFFQFPGKSDIIIIPRTPSHHWHPGHNEKEKGLFPYMAIPEIMKLGFWKWQKPEWAKGPKYKNWMELPRKSIDEWGVIWDHSELDTVGHPYKSPLSDYTQMEEYFAEHTPNSDEKEIFEPFIKLYDKFAKNCYRICLAGYGPFTLATLIRGFSQLLIDHRKYKSQVKKLLEHSTNYHVNLVKMYVKHGAKPHGFIIYDDLGEQNGPFVGPKMFEEFYKPLYKRFFDTVHNLGCDMHMHCCGKIDPILPILIDCGLDAVQLDSPRMTGYPALNQFRGKLMMWGCVNIQSIYPNGTPEECEREVWHMIRNLGTQEGGFGGWLYPSPSQIRVPKENVDAFLNGLRKYGNYSNIPAHWWTYPLSPEWRDNEVPPTPPVKI